MRVKNLTQFHVFKKLYDRKHFKRYLKPYNSERPHIVDGKVKTTVMYVTSLSFYSIQIYKLD